jgi:hypothetical protein
MIRIATERLLYKTKREGYYNNSSYHLVDLGVFCSIRTEVL